MGEETQQAVAAPEAPVDGERQRLMRDAVVNNLAVPVTAVVGILLVPVMLRALGRDNYGLWIIATSISGILAAFDLGLSWSVSREVAADDGSRERDTADFVRSAANVYLLTGIAGCVILGAAGLLSSNMLHLPAAVGHETVTLVFWLVGAALCFDQVSVFGCSVLAGLRRFDRVNFIAVLASIAWAVGAIALLMNGAGVTAIAACYLAVAALKCSWMLWSVARLNHNYSFRLFFFRWKALRGSVSFSVSSMLLAALSGIGWNSAPALIGFVRGPAAAVPFYIGLKFPLAVSMMSWRAAEVLFPAASESRGDRIKSREIMRAGSRGVLVLALPFCTLLFVYAPELLQAWVGGMPDGAVNIMRILTVAVFADALSAAPLNLMWGLGITRPILFAHAVMGLGVAALTVPLLSWFGVEGGAWGMLVPIAVNAAIIVAAALRVCELDLSTLASELLRGLALPVLACVAGASSIMYFGGGNRVWTAAALACGGLAYAITLVGLGNNSNERRFLLDTLSSVRNVVLKRANI